MKTYVVTYFFKNEQDKFTDTDITLDYLLTNIKALYVEEIYDITTDRDGVEFYFKLKKDAVEFSKYHNISISHIMIVNLTKEQTHDPWLPPGMDYEMCMDMYGAIPGDR